MKRKTIKQLEIENMDYLMRIEAQRTTIRDLTVTIETMKTQSVSGMSSALVISAERIAQAAASLVEGCHHLVDKNLLVRR
jgi:hypothetical protein